MIARKTKIICTLGPATDDINVLRELFINGMNVGRLNFSHSTHEEQKVRVDKFMKVRDELQLPVGLLLDTKGPEIRIKQFENGKIELSDDTEFILTTRDVTGNEDAVSVTYKGFPGDVEKGNAVLIDDGLIILEVTGKTDTDVSCRVVSGGELSNNKSINIPGVTNNLPFINDQDLSDILFAIENDFDYIAASFVRDANDVRDLIEILENNDGESIKIISKIENRDGVDNIDDIIRLSNGIMVARGDMGVEILFEELPPIQKEIIKKCYFAGKPVITATQMLDSMIRNPRPTRAEITDVANAIYDGTCGIMLSGETSVGRDPVNAVRTMIKIAIETEKDIDYVKRFKNTHITVSRNVTNAISHATCETAHTLGASAIVSVTKSGHTANVVSKYRPECPIIATTFSRKVFNQLSLSWGVMPLLSEKMDSTDDIFYQAIERASETDIVRDGDLIVITGSMLVDVSGTTNMLKVHIVGDVLLEGKGISKNRASGNVCVFHGDEGEIQNFNAGDVIVIKRTTDEILKAIKNASAIVTEEREDDSQAVIVGKALEIPVITNAVNATEILKSGTIVTVDAKAGRIFSGLKGK